MPQAAFQSAQASAAADGGMRGAPPATRGLLVALLPMCYLATAPLRQARAIAAQGIASWGSAASAPAATKGAVLTYGDRGANVRGWGPEPQRDVSLGWTLNRGAVNHSGIWRSFICTSLDQWFLKARTQVSR